MTVGRKGRDGVLHLCQVSEFDTAGALEPGNSGIQLRLPGKDFANACETLAARGVKFSRPAEKADWGWWAAVVDPDGNELMLAPEASSRSGVRPSAALGAPIPASTPI